MEMQQKKADRDKGLLPTDADQLKSLKKEYEEFTYIISHDLAAPLRHIRQFSSLLLNSLEDSLDDGQQSFAKYINDSVERCQGMLDGLLSLSRVDTRERIFASTDINALIQRTVEVRLGDDLNCVEWALDDVQHISADKYDLEAVFFNLVDNAEKFKRADVPLKIKISTQQHDDVVLVSIEDNGIGFDEKYKESIFDVFRTVHTEEPYAGTGIGLTLCRKIISKHHGKVWCEKAGFEGTIFMLSLPINQ